MNDKVWCVTRVSTSKHSQDESPERQKEIMSAWVKELGLKQVGLSQERVSGAKEEKDRPGLAEAMREIREGRANVLMVTDLDRLGRNLREQLRLADELHKLGADLAIYRMPGGKKVDTQGQGRLLFVILAAVNESVRADSARRSKEGKARAEARGVHCARPLETIGDALGLWVSGYRAGHPLAGWVEVSREAATIGYLQPGRVIKSTGGVRERRPWPPQSLRRAFVRWVESKQKPPVKSPPQSEGGEVAKNEGQGEVVTSESKAGAFDGKEPDGKETK